MFITFICFFTIAAGRVSAAVSSEIRVAAAELLVLPECVSFIFKIVNILYKIYCVNVL